MPIAPCWCDTGVGVAISANNVPGVRAVTAHDSFPVKRSALSHIARVLRFGLRVVGVEPARRLVRGWLGCRGRRGFASAAEVDAITGYEPVAGTTVIAAATDSCHVETIQGLWTTLGRTGGPTAVGISG